MFAVAAVVVGAIIGFVGSRIARRSRPSTSAAAPVRAPSPASVSPPLRRRGGLTIPELQRACFAAMVTQVRAGSTGATRVPDRFSIRLHPDDLAQVDEARAWFTDGLHEALHAEASARGWTIDRPADIRYESDERQRRGLPAVRSKDLSAPPPPPTGPARRSGPAPAPRRSGERLALIRAETGERLVLGSSPATIGRTAGCSFVIDDSRVSRVHATVAQASGGWTITDEGSANGTTVNGVAVTPREPHRLQPGDVVGIGPIEVRTSATSEPAS